MVVFFGYIGFLLFDHERADHSMLQQLKLMSNVPGSFMTTLRIFSSIPFMLDLEVMYKNSTGITPYCLRCGMNLFMRIICQDV